MHYARRKMGNLQFASGSLFANRFEIDCPAGSGGMGMVYRARDRYSDDIVALKLLHGGEGGPNEAERFTREAQILGELRHPGIVSHVAHGQTPDGQRFLAMEWLDGEDLARRLARGPLPVKECVVLMERVADALSVAHQRGIVHRDLKPSNLFLVGGQIEQLKILDFGIARRAGVSQALTRTGTVIGTPEYMAPEQARGSRELTPAADIFSLGCVLYECLAGEPPFVADHIAAVLVRILFEDPLPLEERRPGVPAALSRLIERMLYKHVGQRLADAMALRAELSALGEMAEPSLAVTMASAQPPPPSFAESEQSLCSIVLAAPLEDAVGIGATLPPGGARLEEVARQALVEALMAMGTTPDFLANGALVVTVAPAGSALDQVILAGRAALLIKARWPDAAIALATGRGALMGRTAVGEVVEVAVRVLQTGRQKAGQADESGVVMDALSAKLLSGRFVQTPRPEGALLLAEEKEVDADRTLLGKPTPCVGREAELLTLDAQLASCLEDREARAILVAAPPGAGKSRLRHEFLRRVAKRNESVMVVLGRGDSMTAGAPYGILGRALRSYCGIQTSAPTESQRAKLASQLGRFVPVSQRQRIVEFLGELCGVALPDDGSGRLSAARSAPQKMHDQIRTSFLDWVSAECDHNGLLIVLDDLQWGDTLSVGLLDAALHELRTAPFCLLALARPEVREVFPKLWPGHKVQEVQLKGLSRKACERLAQQVLGKQIAPAVLHRIVEQSNGNALFLEELIRAVGEGEADGQAATVIAMLQARIGRFETGPRRAVRAASVFGQTFWHGGVAELLGLPAEDPQLQRWLMMLVESEVIEPHNESRFADQKEYGFRHALVCDAAYGLLTESDIREGHRFAADYLERNGEREPLMLADHRRLSGELKRAVSLYIRAGEDAGRMGATSEARQLYKQAKAVLDRLDDSQEHRILKVNVLIEQVRWGMYAAPSDQNLALMAEARVLLESIPRRDLVSVEYQRRSAWIDFLRGRASYIKGDLSSALSSLQGVMTVVEVLDDKHLLAPVSLTIGIGLMAKGQVGRGRPLLARAVATPELLDGEAERQRAFGANATLLIWGGSYREGMRLHEESLARAIASKQPSLLCIAYCYRAVSLPGLGDYETIIREGSAALEWAEKSGEQFYELSLRRTLAWSHSSLGNFQEERLHREQAQRIIQQRGGGVLLADWYRAGDAQSALRAGDAEQALTLASELAPVCRKEGTLLGLGLAEQVWGVALGRRDLSRMAEADVHLLAGLQVMEESEQVLAAARLRLEWADLCRRRGSHEQAAVLRAQAVAQFEASGCPHVIEQIERACTLGWPLSRA